MEKFGGIQSLFIPISDVNDKITFKLLDNIPNDSNLRIVAYDVATNMKRGELKLDGYSKSENFEYWWIMAPGNETPEKRNLGDVELHLVQNFEILRKFYLDRGGRGKELKINGNIINYPNNDDSIYPTYWEIFIDNEYDNVGELPNNPIIIDIGSNVGLFCLYAIDKYKPKKIYAVEPNKECIDISKSVLDKFNNVVFDNYAITKHLGKFKLLIENNSSAVGEIIPDNNGDIVGIDINNYLSTIKEENIDLVKIDCEGGELDIFEQITEKNINRIKKFVVEFHSHEIKDVILSKLNESGFRYNIKYKGDKFGIIYSEKI